MYCDECNQECMTSHTLLVQQLNGDCLKFSVHKLSAQEVADLESILQVS